MSKVIIVFVLGDEFILRFFGLFSVLLITLVVAVVVPWWFFKVRPRARERERDWYQRNR